MNMRQAVSRTLRACKRTLRAVKQLATDQRIPHWLRILLAVGMVQIPVLPVDEICLVTALVIIAVRYRQPLLDALATARGK
jgi:hypothetical protein